jgi:hypothetical protein
MATISDLQVRLGLNSAGFNRGLDNSNMKAKSFGTTLKGLGLQLAAFLGPIYIASRALQALGDSFSRLDKLGKTADRLGTTVQSLRGLRMQAELSGVSTEKLDKSLEIFTKRSGQAAAGTGAASKLMSEFGINAKEFINLPLEERLGAVQQLMKETGTQAEKLRIADAFFGREGLELVNALQSGDFKNATAELERLGIKTTRADVAGIERANDAISTLGTATQGLVDIFSSALAPAVAEAAEGLTALVAEINKGTRSFQDQRIVDFRDALQAKLDAKKAGKDINLNQGAAFIAGGFPGLINGLPSKTNSPLIASQNMLAGNPQTIDELKNAILTQNMILNERNSIDKPLAPKIDPEKFLGNTREIGPTSAAVAGSVAAYSAFAQIRNQENQPMQELLKEFKVVGDLTKEQLEEMADTNSYLRAIGVTDFGG